MKKPRIRLRGGIWDCITRDATGRPIRIGYGYTPAQAYEAWRRYS